MKNINIQHYVWYYCEENDHNIKVCYFELLLKDKNNDYSFTLMKAYWGTYLYN